MVKNTVDMDDIRKWLAENKLRAVGLFWVTSVGGSLAYQLTRPIPTSLAIIHSRVYAQALTLAALGMAGLVDVYEHRHQTNQELEKYNDKLSQLEARVHEAMAHGKGGEEMKKLETRLANVHSGGGGSGQLIELERQVQKATQ